MLIFNCRLLREDGKNDCYKKGRGCVEGFLEEIADVGTGGDHAAVGEVTELHNAVDNGKAHSNQGIDSAQRNAADKQL